MMEFCCKEFRRVVKNGLIVFNKDAYFIMGYIDVGDLFKQMEDCNFCPFCGAELEKKEEEQ